MCDKMETQKKGMLKSQVSDSKYINAGVVLRQNSKGHVALCIVLLFKTQKSV